MSASVDEIREFLDKVFPLMRDHMIVEDAQPMRATLRQKIDQSSLRPGGTVSGPTMMGLADAALYIAIFSTIGITPLAVTTSLNFNFLRKPEGNKDITAKCTLMKVGKALAVGEVTIFSDGDTEPVAHAVGTYSIPPNR
ncbi:hypothetical protein GCM10017044_25220 [Kordiimonas sediminis]|uniref:Thioesterase domain-containing protein n=1 Tax=Kordiimonas sediminis TaxID=1735581 RepID=A0A919EA10_9PROT|nr:PaaI family thioesterase [Kordiimonas sediminis]GHF28925.1 hypothetical protein GCM10017044_25220 [Kordiimonas sediminis]